MMRRRTILRPGLIHEDSRTPIYCQLVGCVVALPHGNFTELGIAIKAASRFRRRMVISLANDLDFYIPTRRACEEGNYERNPCPLDLGCGELLVCAAAGLLNELKP
jgi:hypothetical protein